VYCIYGRGGFVLQDDESVGGVGWGTAVTTAINTIDYCFKPM
jgi:hypothetical protein